jgi:hypothetical protein
VPVARLDLEVFAMSHPARRLLKHGGHAPGHLRGLFFALIDQDEDEAEAEWDRHVPPGVDPLWWLCGQLSNCTDIMSSDACEALGHPPGTTFGVAARALRERIRAHDPELAAGAGWRMLLQRLTSEAERVATEIGARFRAFQAESSG